MSEPGGRKGRRLSTDEQALWQHVTRSVRPLRKSAMKNALEPPADTGAAAKAARAKARLKQIAPAAAPSLPVKPKAPPPLAALDKRARQKIARGRSEIDGRLDLHGHTQAEAHAALLRFLRASQARGGRVVLVITGKGAREKGSQMRETGVLRRQVPQWLALAEFRDYVVGFDAAAIGHGGEGALYVRLRKSRG
jgi:DNA-nicking Smr family endonuclease